MDNIYKLKSEIAILEINILKFDIDVLASKIDILEEIYKLKIEITILASKINSIKEIIKIKKNDTRFQININAHLKFDVPIKKSNEYIGMLSQNTKKIINEIPYTDGNRYIGDTVLIKDVNDYLCKILYVFTEKQAKSLNLKELYEYS
jgi:hypothetical protein